MYGMRKNCVFASTHLVVLPRSLVKGVHGVQVVVQLLAQDVCDLHTAFGMNKILSQAIVAISIFIYHFLSSLFDTSLRKYVHKCIKTHVIKLLRFVSVGTNLIENRRQSLGPVLVQRLEQVELLYTDRQCILVERRRGRRKKIMLLCTCLCAR